MLKFSEDHEWAKLDNNSCSVGISPHAVEQLGDIVFVELPEIGTNVDRAMQWQYSNPLKLRLISTVLLLVKSPK